MLTTGFPASPTDLISIKWDMNVLPSGVPSGSFGPFFGVEAYAQPGGGNTVLGSLGVDTGTGDILYYDPVFGFTEVPNVSVTFTDWHMYELLLDFGADEYSIFYDGGLLVSDIPFTDGPASTFSDAPLATLAAGSDPDSQEAIGTGFFDNYVITAIPEPSAMLFGEVVCMCVGASAVVRRKWLGGATVDSD